VNPTPEQHLLNIKLSSLREVIEHVFAEHRMRFQLFEVPARFQILTGGVKVRRVSLVSFFVLNCYNCILGGRCLYFGQIPPTLEEYIPLDEVLVPAPAVNLGTVWDYGSTQQNNCIFASYYFDCNHIKHHIILHTTS
jgi:hypothetical protein